MNKFYHWESPSSLHAAGIRDRCVYQFGRNSGKFIISLLTWNPMSAPILSNMFKKSERLFGLYKETWTPIPRNRIKAEMGLSGKVLKPGADLPFQQWRHYRDRELWVQATIPLAITLLCTPPPPKKNNQKTQYMEIRGSLHGSTVTRCLFFISM